MSFDPEEDQEVPQDGIDEHPWRPGMDRDYPGVTLTEERGPEWVWKSRSSYVK